MTVLASVKKWTHEFVFEPFWKLQPCIKWVRRNKDFSYNEYRLAMGKKKVEQ